MGRCSRLVSTDLEAGSCGLFEGTTAAFAWRDLVKSLNISVRMSSTRVEIGTGYLPYENLEQYQYIKFLYTCNNEHTHFLSTSSLKE
jgi:hypothetical protein